MSLRSNEIAYLDGQVVAIHGKQPGSQNEIYLARAFDYYNWGFAYQVPLFGGRAVRGGFVLDFLLYTSPLPTPVPLHGKAWHGGKATAQDNRLLETLRTRMNGQYNEPVVIFDSDVPSYDAAKAVVINKFGRP